MAWKDPIKNPPEEGEYCWIYMPFFIEKWRFPTCPDILRSMYYNGKFSGIGNNPGCVLYWHKFENTPIPNYITDNMQ